MSKQESIGKRPEISTLTSLTPLNHHVSVIHASAFFHLFNQEQQHQLAHLLGSLLSSEPGSIILGSHAGLEDTEENKEGAVNYLPDGQVANFAHSPTSWNELWTGKNGVFRPDEAKVETETRVIIVTEEARRKIGDANRKPAGLVWCVTRI